MRQMIRTAFVLLTTIALLSALGGAVGAQESEPVGQLAVINGASNEPVNVTAGETTIASGLVYAADGVAAILPAGGYDVAFTGGSIDSTVPVEVAAGSAQTVVSGYGEASSAFSYPVDVSPIDGGMAKVTVWNATGALVLVTIGAEAPIEVPPGQGLPTILVPADTPVAVDIDGVQRDVATPADSYTDVFAVNDLDVPAIAVSIIASMTDLIAAISPPAPGEVPVPDVTGQSAADAQATLEAAGFAVASEDQSSEDVAAGLVIATNPAAGTSVAPGSTVTMIVSTGPEAPATVPVPDVTGQSAADAQATLEAAGFAVTTSEQSSEDVEEGLVIETNPTAGTEVAPGTTVNMTVSTGLGDVVVPEFIGMTVPEATEAAKDAGLTISFVEDPDDPDPDGIVVDQDPEAGAEVPPETEVVAQLSPAVGEAWAIVTVDPDRLMTVTGINFQSGSTTELSVVGTNLSATADVGDDGVWVATFDLSGVQNEAETLLVVGTAADGSVYDATFTIPAAGESTDVPVEEESTGFPWWGWLLIIVALAALAVLIWWFVAGRNQSSSGDGAAAEQTTEQV